MRFPIVCAVSHSHPSLNRFLYNSQLKAHLDIQFFSFVCVLISLLLDIMSTFAFLPRLSIALEVARQRGLLQTAYVPLLRRSAVDLKWNRLDTLSSRHKDDTAGIDRAGRRRKFCPVLNCSNFIVTNSKCRKQ